MSQQLESPLHDGQLAMLGCLAGILSHEFYNPLGTIFLYVDILEEILRQPKANNRTDVTEALGKIRTELTHINDLVQDYLGLMQDALSPARLAERHRMPIDLGTVVQAFAMEIREELAQHGIDLRLEGLTTLGQVDLHLCAFRYALLTLVQNAIATMPQGGMVTFSGQREGHQARLEIRHTGPGFSKDQLSRLFTPFYALKSKDPGLALYMVQQIVSAQGGTITVHSKPRMGTTWIVKLPHTIEAEEEL